MYTYILYKLYRPRPTCDLKFIKYSVRLNLWHPCHSYKDMTYLPNGQAINHLHVVLMQLSLFYGNKVRFTALYAC